ERREDSNPRVSALERRVHEDGLREIHLARDRLQQMLGHEPRVREHGELISRQRPIGEDVADHIPELHGAGIVRDRWDLPLRAPALPAQSWGGGVGGGRRAPLRKKSWGEASEGAVEAPSDAKLRPPPKRSSSACGCRRTRGSP